MNRLSIVFLAGICCTLGCASLTSFQEARTLEKGTGRFHVAYTQYSETIDSVPAKGFMLQVAGRYGISERFDCGITYIIPGSIIVDGKYMLTSRESPLAASSGLKLGYLSDESTFGTVRAIDAVLPLNLSYYPVSWTALTLTPDAFLRVPLSGSNAKILFCAGGNGNLRLGTKFGAMVEYGYHIVPGSNHTFTTAGAAFYTPLSLESFLEMAGDIFTRKR